MPIARYRMPDGRIARFQVPDGTTPAQAQKIGDDFAANEAQQAQQQAETESAQQGEPTLPNLLAEGVSAANRGVSGIADVLLSPINVGLELAGSERRVSLSDIPGVEIQPPGTFAGENLPSQIAQGIGGMIPAAVGGGAVARTAASLLPAKALGESALVGTARTLGQSTIPQDVVGGALAGAGQPIGGEIGETLADEQGRNVGELFGGAAAPLLTAIPTAARNLIKKGIGGAASGFNTMREALRDFAEIGDTPSLGTASQNNFISNLENRSAQIFGGAPVRNAAERVTNSMQKRVNEIADDISKVTGDVEVGRVIQKGIQGEGGFVDRKLAESGNLWRNFDNFVNDDIPVVAGNTTRILDDLVNDTQFGRFLNNPVINGIREELRQTNSQIDYGTFRALRSSIGEKLGSKDLVSDVPRAQLKRLYGALSEDLREVARTSGAREIRPGFNEAEQALNRANRFTSAFHGRIDDFVERTTGKVDLDKVFNAVAKGGEGVQAINAVKRSLKPEEWEAVGANVIRRLGRATPGQQDAGGDVFSVNKLITDWNKLGPAKNALFSGSPRLNEYRANLDKIASAAGRFKEASKQGANPSGTAQAAANITIGLTGGGAALTGNVPVLMTVLTGVAANSGAARLMSNPAFVRWVAKGTQPNVNAAGMIASLESLAKQTGEFDAITELIGDIQGIGQSDNPTNPQVPNTNRR